MVAMRRNLAFGALLLAVGLSACDRGSGSESAPAQKTQEAAKAPPAKLTDLSSSLAAARQAFNAYKGEPRFLTLLSPT